jgi:hypothetical protein
MCFSYPWSVLLSSVNPDEVGECLEQHKRQAAVEV